jgi:hypothetical protein
VVAAGVGRVTEVHRRGLELEEVTVVQRVGRGGGARWTKVWRSASARREEKQRRGVSG